MCCFTTCNGAFCIFATCNLLRCPGVVSNLALGFNTRLQNLSKKIILVMLVIQRCGENLDSHALDEIMRRSLCETEIRLVTFTG